jgi:hypothetical protein
MGLPEQVELGQGPTRGDQAGTPHSESTVDSLGESQKMQSSQLGVLCGHLRLSVDQPCVQLENPSEVI